MKRTAIALLLFIGYLNSYGQYYTSYDWKEKPILHEVSEEDKKEPSIGILKNHIVEYFITTADTEPVRYETEHTITRVNTDVGISQHNTVYIPMYEVEQVVDIKARTINSQGKITLLNKDNIKEVKNVEEYGDFKIFAIEGVEKNSEIEVLYTVKKPYELYGSEVLQSNYPIKRVEFSLVLDSLSSNVKAYRTDEEFINATVDGKKAKKLTLNNVPAMIEEEYATPLANKIEVVYQVFPQEQDVNQDMFWGNVAYNIGRQLFPNSVPELVANDIEKMLDGRENLSEFEKASLVDNFIKSNFSIIKNQNPDLSNLEYILKNKTASDFGILKVYANYLTAMDLDFEFVVTANRYQLKFDPDFFLPNMLRDFLIYLPNEKKYIAPDRLENRVGEAPFSILGNYGLFIKRDLDYYFKKIDQADPEFSRIQRNMEITFSEDWENVIVKEYQEYYGNWASTNRAVLGYTSEQQKQEFKDYLTGSGIEDKDILEYELKNTELNQTEYNLPFIVNSTIESGSLLEDAGDSYIFLVGKVIGTQSELYQETDRVNPIEMQYPNRYNYSIKIEIPEGYSVEGLSSLKINKSYLSPTGEKIAKFESDYTKEGNDIIITIEEFYKDQEYDLDRYEEFRSVINAASDFNKASILIKANN